MGLQRARDLLTDTRTGTWQATEHASFTSPIGWLARKAGFADLLQAFTDRGSLAKDALTDGSDRRIAFFLEKFEPLALAWEKDRSARRWAGSMARVTD